MFRSYLIKAAVVGKPEAAFFRMGAATLGENIDIESTVMIGDDVKDDVMGAINCGMKGILVRTRKYRTGRRALRTPRNYERYRSVLINVCAWDAPSFSLCEIFYGVWKRNSPMQWVSPTDQ